MNFNKFLLFAALLLVTLSGSLASQDMSAAAAASPKGESAVDSTAAKNLRGKNGNDMDEPRQLWGLRYDWCTDWCQGSCARMWNCGRCCWGG